MTIVNEAPFAPISGSVLSSQDTSDAFLGVSTPKEVAFLDAGLADLQTLIDGLQPGTLAYVIDDSSDALSQIGDVLAGYSDLAAVKIFSHGSDGALQLGGQLIDADALTGAAGVLQSWSRALSEEADLLLFGCDLAASETGQAFVQQFATLTGADVAASTDLTGSAVLGADWDLEFVTGSIEASGFLSDWAQADYQQVLATYTVNTLSDVVDANDSFLSLREAITQANANAGEDTVNFASGLTGTITLTGGQLVLTDSARTTINGGNAITVSGNNATRVLQVFSGAEAVLNDLTITRGGGSSNGGGIFNLGMLTVNNSTLSDNSANSGGGILNFGALTVNNSTLNGNSASFAGGAIYSVDSNATLTIRSSTISGNSAGAGGGGIGITGGSTATIRDSTISGNSTDGIGGGISLFEGSLNLTNSLVTGNGALRGDEVFVNTDGSFTSSYNLLGDSNKTFAEAFIGFTPSATDIVVTSTTSAGTNNDLATALSAILATQTIDGDVVPLLADNGGPTQTIALVAGSPAIDRGDTTLITDQRGISRPQGAADDIGAFEYVPPNIPPVATDDSFTTNEDTSLTVMAANGVLSNDTDAENDTLTAILVSGPANGSLTLNSDGSFTYTPNANFNGSDSFTYKANDGTADSDVATVTLTIDPVNDDPVLTGAKATLVNGTEDTSYTISAADLLTGYTDVDGDTLSVSGLTATNGSLTNNNDGTYTFNPNANYNGVVNLNYTVIDGNSGSVAATQSFTLDAVNDAPVLTVPDSQNLLTGSAQLIDGISISDVDAEGGELTLTMSVTNGTIALGGQSGATVELTSTLAELNTALQGLTYNSGDFTGDASLSITVNDNGNTGNGSALSDMETIALSVAQNVGTLGNRALTFEGSLSSSDPIDRYQFTLDSDTDKFRLTLGELSANANIRILDSEGNVVVESTNSGIDAEVINNLSLLAGTYFIEVGLVEDIFTNYELSFRA